jgi:hypothetical protein
MHAGVFILEDRELVNFSELLEHRSEIVLLQVSWYLSDEEFDNIAVGTGLCSASRVHCRRGRDKHSTPFNPSHALPLSISRPDKYATPDCIFPLGPLNSAFTKIHPQTVLSS